MKKVLLSSIIIIILTIILINYKMLNNETNDKSLIINNNAIDNNNKELKSNVDLIILKVAHYFPETHPQHIALRNKFVPIIEEKSNWKIRVELYPNNKLGIEKDYIKGVKNGTIEMCIGSQALLDELPELSIIKFPNIFDDYEEANRILNDTISPKIVQSLHHIGIRNLGWGLNGFNQISISEKNIENYNKQKLKIATRQDKLNINTLDVMGFVPYVSNINETEMLLKQDIVNGHDYPLLLNYNNGWYKYQNTLYVSNHILSADMYMINEQFFESLSEENKNLIIAAVQETANYEIELLESMEQDIYKTLEQEGVSIKYPNLLPYKASVTPLYDQLIGDNVILKDIFETIQNLD